MGTTIPVPTGGHATNSYNAGSYVVYQLTNFNGLNQVNGMDFSTSQQVNQTSRNFPQGGTWKTLYWADYHARDHKYERDRRVPDECPPLGTGQWPTRSPSGLRPQTGNTGTADYTNNARNLAMLRHYASNSNNVPQGAVDARQNDWAPGRNLWSKTHHIPVVGYNGLPQIAPNSSTAVSGSSQMDSSNRYNFKANWTSGASLINSRLPDTGSAYAQTVSASQKAYAGVADNPTNNPAGGSQTNINHDRRHTYDEVNQYGYYLTNPATNGIYSRNNFGDVKFNGTAALDPDGLPVQSKTGASRVGDATHRVEDPRRIYFGIDYRSGLDRGTLNVPETLTLKVNLVNGTYTFMQYLYDKWQYGLANNQTAVGHINVDFGTGTLPVTYNIPNPDTRGGTAPEAAYNRLVYRTDIGIDKRSTKYYPDERRYMGFGTPNSSVSRAYNGYLDDIIRRDADTVYISANASDDIRKERLKLRDWVWSGSPQPNTRNNRLTGRIGTRAGQGMGMEIPHLELYDEDYLNTLSRFSGNRHPFLPNETTGNWWTVTKQSSADALVPVLDNRHHAGNNHKIKRQGDSKDEAMSLYSEGFVHMPVYDPDDWGIRLEYLDYYYSEPTQSGNMVTNYNGTSTNRNEIKHYNRPYSLAPIKEPPVYRGINPIVIHNPVSTSNIWVHDVPQAALQDQRVNSSDKSLVDYNGALNDHGNLGEFPTRNYIDYDFKVTWENVGAFYAAGDNWYSANSAEGEANRYLPDNWLNHFLTSRRFGPGQNPALEDTYFGYVAESGSESEFTFRGIFNIGSIATRINRTRGASGPDYGLFNWRAPDQDGRYGLGEISPGIRGSGYVGVYNTNPSKGQTNRPGTIGNPLISNPLNPQNNENNSEGAAAFTTTITYRSWKYVQKTSTERTYARQLRSNRDSNKADATLLQDTSQWTQAKYIRFENVNVRYLSRTYESFANTSVLPLGRLTEYVAENGTYTTNVNDIGAYYPAGTWITLWDRSEVGYDPDEGENYTAKTYVPIEFVFHITSNTKDYQEAEYQFVTESINVPSELRGNPAAQYSDGQELVNSMRDRESYQTRPSAAAPSRPLVLSASHSATNKTNSDIIGRIGNVIVDDTSDPRWATTFWNRTSEWLIPNVVRKPSIITDPCGSGGINRYFSIQYALFEESIPNINAATNPAIPASKIDRFNDRWTTLKDFHQASGRLGGLPIVRGENRNHLYDTPPVNLLNQTIKLGYEIQFSVQTLGDYDTEMHVIPDFELIGDFSANANNNGQSLSFTPDINNGPSDASKQLIASGFSFYASQVGGGQNQLKKLWERGDPYNPVVDYQHILGHTLASPRAKIDCDERATPSFTSAKETNLVKLGTPSLLIIPQDLRTHIGYNNTYGNVQGFGEANKIPDPDDPTRIIATRVGAPDAAISAGNTTYTNAQRWHARFGLPSTTTVSDNSGKFAKKTEDQFIVTYFTFRARSTNRVPWDLTTKTSTDAETEYTADDVSTEEGNPSVERKREKPRISFEIPNYRTPSQSRSRWGRYNWNRRGSDETSTSRIRTPRVPIVVFDYSNDSSTDSEIVGTH